MAVVWIGRLVVFQKLAEFEQEGMKPGGIGLGCDPGCQRDQSFSLFALHRYALTGRPNATRFTTDHK